jgi:DNA anti-recombination protein RmuC
MKKILIVLMVLLVLASVVYATMSYLDLFNRKVLTIAEEVAGENTLNATHNTQAELEQLLAGIQAELETYAQEQRQLAQNELSNNEKLKGLQRARDNAVGQGKAKIDELINNRKQQLQQQIDQEVNDIFINLLN